MDEKDFKKWEQGVPVTVEKLNAIYNAICNRAEKKSEEDFQAHDIAASGTISEQGARVYSPNNKPTAADAGAVGEYTRLIDMTSSTYKKDTYYPVAFGLFCLDKQLSEFVITHRAHQDFNGSANLLLQIQCRPNTNGHTAAYFHMAHTTTYWTSYQYLLGKVVAHEKSEEMILFLRGGHSYNVVAKGVNSGFTIIPKADAYTLIGGVLTVAPFEAGSNYVEPGTYESVENNTTITKNEHKVLGSNNMLYDNGRRVYNKNYSPANEAIIGTAETMLAGPAIYFVYTNSLENDSAVFKCDLYSRFFQSGIIALTSSAAGIFIPQVAPMLQPYLINGLVSVRSKTNAAVTVIKI